LAGSTDVATPSWPRQIPQPSEANLIVPNYTPEELKKLPLRAIVALSARCSRRVEHLAVLPGDEPESARCRGAVGAALQITEDFARGLLCPSVGSVVREIEACRAIGEGMFAHDLAVAAVVRAACAAATARRDLDLRVELEERPAFGAVKTNPFPQLADIRADRAAWDAFSAAVEAAAADGQKTVSSMRPSRITRSSCGLASATTPRPESRSTRRRKDRLGRSSRWSSSDDGQLCLPSTSSGWSPS
jgi:hypothetical protein